jgi:GH15 family glucan-1,4-alpha-glucosidase
LLDWETGGYFQVAPRARFRVRREYLAGSLILVTTFTSGANEARLIDFFAMRQGGRIHPRRELVRIIEGVSGTLQLAVRIAPRFDFGEVRPWIRRNGQSAFVAAGGNTGILMFGDVPFEPDGAHGLRAEVRIAGGERVHLALQFVAPEDLHTASTRAEDRKHLAAHFEETLRWWRDWASKLVYPDSAGAAVLRSAIVLKALTYAPTGAIIAAPTTSLPEQVGGPRNWEIRSRPRHFVHSKVMCWAAVHRGIALAERYSLPAPLRRWRRVRAEIRRAIESRGIDRVRGNFVESFGSAEVDAALLLIPTVEFVAYQDERMLRTVDAIYRDLRRSGLVVRYRTADGLPRGEGVFLPCTFWLAECLAHQGRREDAWALFERASACANDLGLFAEEFDPRAKQLLGNFPQGLTHLAHISAALALNGVTASAEGRPDGGIPGDLRLDASRIGHPSCSLAHGPAHTASANGGAPSHRSPLTWSAGPRPSCRGRTGEALADVARRESALGARPR